MMEIEAFLTDYLGGKSAWTRKAYRGYLQRYEQFLDDIGVAVHAAERRLIEQFAAWVKQLPNFKTKREGMSDTTVKSHLCAVRSYYGWRQEYDRELRNPASEFRYRRTEAPRKVDPVAPAIANAACRKWLVKRDVAIFRLFRGSGVRLDELIQLNKESIGADIDDAGVPLCADATVIGKGRKTRVVLIDEVALQAILEYQRERGHDDEPALFISNRGCRISRRTVQRVIARMTISVGGGHAHPHQLRHSFGTEQLNAGLPEPQLQKQLGHELRNTTYTYATISEAVAIAQYDRAMEINEEDQVA